MAIMHAFISILSQITAEPTVFFLAIGNSLENGARITTDLLINKICHFELNYDETVCANLTNEGFENYNDEVQSKVNNFLLVSQWIGQPPTLIYSFFAGSLLDYYGCKPFILLPLIGMLIQSICMFINCAFFDNLPLEFFYLNNATFLFGFPAVFYLGTYTFGTLNTKSVNRARTLARYDGFETIGMLLGMVLAPTILSNFGALTNYGLKIGFILCAILYTFFFIPFQSGSNQNSSQDKTFWNLLVSPVIEMFKCLFKKRPDGLHWLIAIQVYLFSTYWFCGYEGFEMRYLYLLKSINGFTGSDYSYYSTYNNSLACIGLLVLLPIFSNYFKLHDAMILTLCCATEAMSILLVVLCKELWQVYLATAVQILCFVKFGLVRSLLSKCVDRDETGKIFSSLAIFTCLAPMLANVVFRQVYNLTLATFPGAEMVMAAGILIISAILNFYLYTQRHRMSTSEEKSTIKSDTIWMTSI